MKTKVVYTTSEDEMHPKKSYDNIHRQANVICRIESSSDPTRARPSRYVMGL
jgi:hypothetical protein